MNEKLDFEKFGFKLKKSGPCSDWYTKSLITSGGLIGIFCFDKNIITITIHLDEGFSFELAHRYRVDTQEQLEFLLLNNERIMNEFENNTS